MIIVFVLLFVGVMIAAQWRIFEKAGQPGWACLVPIYNYITLLKIVGKPWSWIFLMLIPIVNVVYAVWVINLLMKSFGKNEGWTVGAIFLPFIFYPMLAWGDAEYQYATASPDRPDILDAGMQ